MNAGFEIGTVAAPSHGSSRAWRRGLLAASIVTVGVLVGIGASELVDGSTDTAPPPATVESNVSPDAAQLQAPASTDAPDLSGLSPDAAARWLETHPSTDRSDVRVIVPGGKFLR